ncbi:hypothetical protein ACH4F6_38135 [Streptomyces sp. NPDC017936]|uniref:hypothetical protein n=1 Tax=Streptomyces sp. NPDC017936 TaxID=3365016 RepID=UPI00378BFED2
MPGMTPAVFVVLVPTVYLLSGAFGLLLTTFAHVVRLQGLPPVLRGATGFWGLFHLAARASATWPWTWRKWTDG